MSKRTIKIIVGVIGLMVGLLILFVGGLAALLWVLGNIMCGDELIQEVYSPTRQYKALVYTSSCGATTDYSAHIAILEGDAAYRFRPGNVFRSDGHPDRLDIKVSWEDDSHLIVEYNGQVEPFFTATQFRDIAIRIIVNTESVTP